MAKGQFSFFRFLLFLAGAGIYVLALYLVNDGFWLLRDDIFVWVSIAIMYLVFFVPFFFSSINISNFSGKIPLLSLAWTGIIIYILASIGVIYLLKYQDLFLNTAILIQAVLLFLFFIDIYFAYFASAHAREVEAKEQTLRQYISEIKSQARVLSLSAETLPPEFEGAKKTIQQALEDIQYLSPVGGGAGDDLETKILSSLNFLTELCDGLSSGLHPPALETEAKNLQMIIKQRKLLRN
jgi:hypothetical protein